MTPLETGVKPAGHDWRRPRLLAFMTPDYQRDDDTGKIVWRSVAWAAWWRGWLPHHVVRWLEARAVAFAIHRRRQLGDWWIVPDGYRCDVIRKQPGGTGDPLQQYETIGFKLTPVEGK